MKSLVPLIILISIVTLFTIAIIYLSKRFSWYFDFEKAMPLYIAFISATIFMIAGVFFFSNATATAGHIIYIIAAVIMGFMLYLLLSVLTLDIVHMFSRFQPKTYGISAIILASLVSVFGIVNSYNIRTSQLELPMNGLTREIKVVHLSDIHIGHFRGKKFLNRIVEKANQYNVDAVFITGDLMDGKIALKDENFNPLKSINAPVYFVEGNHDIYTGVTEIKNRLKKAGVYVLENEVTYLNDLQLIGLNHMLADSNAFDMHASGHKSTIKETLANLTIDKNKASILLHHSPDGVAYANNEGIDLYLTGHTHAGQLFPLYLITKLLFKFNKGIHDFNGTKVYVSQGLGTFGPPMRIGTKSEIFLLKLIPK